MNILKNTKIKKYLFKKREEVLVDLNISDYSNNNFYVALVYNHKIDMYKVLYIPFDIVEDGKIDDYVCYQFIDMLSVNHIIRCFEDAKNIFNEKSFRRSINKNIKSYGIEINYNYKGDSYDFKATRYIPLDWMFMFDTIITLFEHVPHVVSGVVEDILMLFKDPTYDIPYQESFKFDLLRDDDAKLYKKFGKEVLDYKKVKYLDTYRNNYIAIVNGHIVIINNDFGVVNTYCDCDDYKVLVLTAIMGIRNNENKEFNKIMLIDRERASKAKYLYVSDLCDKGIKYISGCYERTIPYSDYDDGLIKFVLDNDGMEDKIKKKNKK